MLRPKGGYWKRALNVNGPKGSNEYIVRTRKEVTGNFVIDNYTRRQSQIIMDKIPEGAHKSSKREIMFIIEKAEKLGDDRTLQVIRKLYSEIINHIEEKLPPVSLKELMVLVKSSINKDAR